MHVFFQSGNGLIGVTVDQVLSAKEALTLS
jgi:hypothetical protein